MALSKQHIPRSHSCAPTLARVWSPEEPFGWCHLWLQLLFPVWSGMNGEKDSGSQSALEVLLSYLDHNSIRQFVVTFLTATMASVSVSLALYTVANCAETWGKSRELMVDGWCHTCPSPKNSIFSYLFCLFSSLDNIFLEMTNAFKSKLCLTVQLNSNRLQEFSLKATESESKVSVASKRGSHRRRRSLTPQWVLTASHWRAPQLCSSDDESSECGSTDRSAQARAHWSSLMLSHWDVSSYVNIGQTLDKRCTKQIKPMSTPSLLFAAFWLQGLTDHW